MRVQDPEIHDRIRRFKDACVAAGVKLTHQRLEIFREVAGAEDHPNAEEIWRAVRRRIPTVSLDTVYRALWLLNDIGAIATLGPPRERTRFDANTTPHHHHVCIRCGLARDFQSEEFGALRIPPEVSSWGSVLGIHVELRGLCRACMHEADSRRPPCAPRQNASAGSG